MNWKLELNVQYKRSNGVGQRKKIEVEIDSSKIGIIANQKNGLPLITQLVGHYFTNGEVITSYTYRKLNS